MVSDARFFEIEPLDVWNAPKAIQDLFGRNLPLPTGDFDAHDLRAAAAFDAPQRSALDDLDAFLPKTGGQRITHIVVLPRQQVGTADHERRARPHTREELTEFAGD